MTKQARRIHQAIRIAILLGTASAAALANQPPTLVSGPKTPLCYCHCEHETGKQCTKMCELPKYEKRWWANSCHKKSTAAGLRSRPAAPSGLLVRRQFGAIAPLHRKDHGRPAARAIFRCRLGFIARWLFHSGFAGLGCVGMRRLYTLLLYLALPFATLIILWRGLRTRDYWRGGAARFGLGAARAGGGVWVHAVSVGEVQVAVS